MTENVYFPNLFRHTSNMSRNYSHSEASVSTDEGLLFHPEEIDQVAVSSQSGKIFFRRIN